MISPPQAQSGIDMNSQSERFIRIFAGRKDARGTIEGGCVRETLKMVHVHNHLEGKESLGRYPLLDDGTCRWAVVDFDFKRKTDRVELAEKASRKFANKLFELGIKAFCFERSKSGMIHLWLFFSKPIKAIKIRKVLLFVAKKLDLRIANGEVEIFPKQDVITAGQVGNYVHIPYFGENKQGQLDKRVMLNQNTLKPIPIEVFLDQSWISSI